MRHELRCLIIQGFLMALVASLAAPVAAQDGRPATTEESAAEARPFLRVADEAGRKVSLEIASRDYVPTEGDGPTVTLMGVAHIGEQAFYRDLQKELEGYDVVLYESVMPPGARGPAGETDEQRIDSTRAAMGFVGSLVETFHFARDRYPEDPGELVAFAAEEDARLGHWVENAMTDAWGRPLVYGVNDDGLSYTLMSWGADGRVGGSDAAKDIQLADLPAPTAIDFAASDDNIQVQLADALRMEFQLSSLDYDRPNWRCSDMSIDEVNREMAERGVDFEILGGALGGTSMFAKLAKVFLGLMRFADSLLDGAIADMVKVTMIEMLGNESLTEMSLQQFGEGFEEVIVDLRNQVVIDDLKRIIAEERDVESIAILYGAAHMNDMAGRLADQLGYQPADESWHSAIEVDLERSAITERDLRQMRAMMRQMMRMQMLDRQR